MRPVLSSALAGALALAGTAMIAGGAWAAPDDGRGRSEAARVCGDDARACPADTGVIDPLPDSFFEGGGGVGPQVVEGSGGYAVWVRGAGSGAARSQVQATAAVRVNVEARTHVRGRR